MKEKTSTVPEAGQSSAPTACYAAMFGLLHGAAKKCGYALAPHGSMQRDFDMIAVPWTVEATDDVTLAESLRAACGGKICGGITNKDGSVSLNPVEKPHGRKGWVIHLGGGPYLDVSVMPRMPHNGHELSHSEKNQ